MQSNIALENIFGFIDFQKKLQTLLCRFLNIEWFSKNFKKNVNPSMQFFRKSILTKFVFSIFRNKKRHEKKRKSTFFVQNWKIVTIFWKATIKPQARFFRYDFQKMKKITKIDFWDFEGGIDIKVLRWHSFFQFFIIFKKKLPHVSPYRFLGSRVYADYFYKIKSHCPEQPFCV